MAWSSFVILTDSCSFGEGASFGLLSEKERDLEGVLEGDFEGRRTANTLAGGLEGVAESSDGTSTPLGPDCVNPIFSISCSEGGGSASSDLALMVNCFDGFWRTPRVGSSISHDRSSEVKQSRTRSGHSGNKETGLRQDGGTKYSTGVD
jgi:hypothetical protein